MSKEKKHKEEKDIRKTEGAIKKKKRDKGAEKSAKKHKKHKDKKHKHKKDKKRDRKHEHSKESRNVADEQVAPQNSQAKDLNREADHSNVQPSPPQEKTKRDMADKQQQQQQQTQVKTEVTLTSSQQKPAEPASMQKEKETLKKARKMKRRKESTEQQQEQRQEESTKPSNSRSSESKETMSKAEEDESIDDKENRNSNDEGNEQIASTSNDERPRKRRRKTELKTKTVQNRLQPKFHRVIESEDINARSKYRNRRLLEGESIRVGHDDFISDSDSDSSSGEDDDDDENYKPRYPWHESPRKDVKSRVNKYGWEVSTGQWTGEERIKLEKQVKKVCKRQGISFEDFQTMVAEPARKHLRFWWRIAKPFPNRALYHIIRHTRTAYHAGQYRGRWTEEEDKKLLDLLGTTANNYLEVGKALGRSADACRSRARALRDQAARRVPTGQRWTKEDVAKLKEATAKYEDQGSSAIPWEQVSKETFNSKFTPTQLHRKFWDTGGFVQIQSLRKMDVPAQLALFKRMREFDWKKESDIVFNRVPCKEAPFTPRACRDTYLRIRVTVPDFQKKSFTEILDYLIEHRETMVANMQNAT